MPDYSQHKSISLADPKIMRSAIVDSFRKLDPRLIAKNPVMFVVEVGAFLTSLQLAQNRCTPQHPHRFPPLRQHPS